MKETEKFTLTEASDLDEINAKDRKRALKAEKKKNKKEKRLSLKILKINAKIDYFNAITTAETTPRKLKKLRKKKNNLIEKIKRLQTGTLAKEQYSVEGRLCRKVHVLRIWLIIFIVLFVVLLALSIIGQNILYGKMWSAKRWNWDLEDENWRLEDENWDLENFLDYNVRAVNTGYRKYHKFECYRLNENYCTVIDAYRAQAGMYDISYYPCDECCWGE